MNTILLGNLIKIRWIAIFGQFFAVFIVSTIINIQIPFIETLTIILLSVAVNFYSYFEERKNKSISNIKAFSFDLKFVVLKQKVHLKFFSTNLQRDGRK